MPMDPSYYATLTWAENKTPAKEELPPLIRSLAQLTISQMEACECKNKDCMSLSSFETIPCREAKRAWARAQLLLGGEVAKTDNYDRISELDEWIKEHPQLKFSVEYLSCDGAGMWGSREWYEGGRLVARQNTSPQIVWGERETL